MPPVFKLQISIDVVINNVPEHWIWFGSIILLGQSLHKQDTWIPRSKRALRWQCLIISYIKYWTHHSPSDGNTWTCRLYNQIPPEMHWQNDQVSIVVLGYTLAWFSVISLIQDWTLSHIMYWYTNYFIS